MRTSGILLHISSLPSKYGIGTMGHEAYKFVDYLAKANQRIWQILPLGPTTYGDSPYSSTSSFAFNPYFIDLELLVEDGLLKEEDLPNNFESREVDYGFLFNTRYKILHKAFLNKDLFKDEFEEFIKKEDYWLDDFALFTLLKKEHENRAWNEWYDDFRYKKDQAINWAKNEFKDKILEEKFIQFLFVKQWMKLKAYANKKGIEIMGDMPIYCSYDSADVWANPSNFLLGDYLLPKCVAGCPPDAFSSTGQLWGNPIYDYKKMKENHYSWWVSRVKHQLQMFDILRIDHFRGFAGYYTIPYGRTDATIGKWEEGPGYELFKEIEKACPNSKIVAENLGFLTKDVFDLLKKCGYPGMNIFQFELGDGIKNVPLKKPYKPNTIFYSGTHDNQTIMSFYTELNENNKALVDKLCNIGIMDRPNLKIIEFCFNTNCNYVIIPFQDYLGLTDRYGRMNTPSTVGLNWRFRCFKSDFSKELNQYIKDITIKYNR